MRSRRCFFVVFLILLTVSIVTIGYSVSTVDADADTGTIPTLPMVPPIYYAEATAEANSAIENGFYSVYAKVDTTDNDAGNYSGGCNETAYKEGLGGTATANAYIDGHSPSGQYHQDHASDSYP